MAYIDACVTAVPSANREKYREHARIAIEVLKDCGATRVWEGWGDDVPGGEVTSFPMAVKLEQGETVCVSWVMWPSREARDAGWQKLMADPRMSPESNPMCYDGKRMIFGGFEMLAEG